jgi:FemAB-related protein (PEP-CTERM system-associated)
MRTEPVHRARSQAPALALESARPEIRTSEGEPNVVSARSRASLTAVGVTMATESDRGDWDAFVTGAARDASVGDLHEHGYLEWGWRAVFERRFGHRCVYLMARRDGRVEGVLPLVYIKSRLFGRTMTSLPFVNYGGVLAEADEVGRALVDAAADEARARRCRYVELRHFGRRFQDFPSKQHKVTMRLPLEPGMWERLDRKVRNQIRKAEKSGLTVVSGGGELLDEFYTVFARNMRDLGTPVYARRFFDEILRAFPGRIRLVIVRLKDAPIAGGVTYRTNSIVQVPWASSIRDHNSLCPNHLLYWHAIESAVADGCHVFDFGRSTPNEGTYKFKEQWGAAPVALNWEYCLLQGGDLPDQSPKNPKFQMAIQAWKRLPLWVANAVGPYIVTSIP